jgi:hypothetical protein
MMKKLYRITFTHIMSCDDFQWFVRGRLRTGSVG